MIKLHKMNGDDFLLNSRHIETVEERPDTVITLINEKKYLVKESIDEIIEKVIAFEQKANINVTRHIEEQQ